MKQFLCSLDAVVGPSLSLLGFLSLAEPLPVKLPLLVSCHPRPPPLCAVSSAWALDP